MIKLLLCSAVMVAAPAVAQVSPSTPVRTVAVTGTVLDISAEGEATRVPDIATVRAGVVTQAATAAEASRENATRMRAVVAALRRTGLAERDIQTARVELQPRYQYGENQPPVITGYQASNSVEIRFRDIAKAGAILDALVREGANQIDGPNFSVDRPEPALDEARTAAVRIARERAELYARATGLRVKRILAISESQSSFVPPPVMLQAARRGGAEAADTPIVPGEQRLQVTVNVSFELE